LTRRRPEAPTYGQNVGRAAPLCATGYTLTQGERAPLCAECTPTMGERAPLCAECTHHGRTGTSLRRVSLSHIQGGIYTLSHTQGGIYTLSHTQGGIYHTLRYTREAYTTP